MGAFKNSRERNNKVLVEKKDLTWKHLFDECNFSKVTLAKYIESLNNHGLIKYAFNDTYALNDEMLRTWLLNKKETEGQYPI